MYSIYCTAALHCIMVKSGALPDDLFGSLGGADNSNSGGGGEGDDDGSKDRSQVVGAITTPDRPIFMLSVLSKHAHPILEHTSLKKGERSHARARMSGRRSLG
jgi:hypothetical protein